jgi:hypothetical protein
LSSSERIVLMAMADHAMDDGTSCFPSVGRLAWKTDYSGRQVRRILRALEEKELIVPVKNISGGGRATEYIIHIEKGVPKLPFLNKNTPDTMSGCKTQTTDTMSGLKSHTQDIAVSPTPDIAVSAEPSLTVKEKEKREASASLKPVKKTYGEFQNVILTDQEHEKLIDRFGGAVVQDKITALDLGIQSKGYKYKSHYATILNWDRMRKEEEKPLVEAF